MLEVMGASSLTLIAKASSKFLETPQQETYHAVDQLYKIAESTLDAVTKLTLFDVLISYTRIRGIQMYLAQSLLQKYLIVRTDLKRLEETYKDGEDSIPYADFLSTSEQIHAANALLEIYADIHDIESTGEVIRMEEIFLITDVNTPVKQEELGRYYRWKGLYQIQQGLFREAADCYLHSILHYGRVSAHEEVHTCMRDILELHCVHEKHMDLELLLQSNLWQQIRRKQHKLRV